MADLYYGILILEADIVWLIVSGFVQTPLKIPYSWVCLSVCLKVVKVTSQSLLKIYSFIVISIPIQSVVLFYFIGSGWSEPAVHVL